MAGGETKAGRAEMSADKSREAQRRTIREMLDKLGRWHREFSLRLLADELIEITRAELARRGLFSN